MTAAQTSKKEFNPLQFLSFQGPYKILHMTWFAFFLTFMAWFNMAPLATTMIDQLEWLTSKNIKILLICNVALTIPARIIIGMLLDKFGPRKVYSGLLVIMSIPCFIFAWADSMTMAVISRLLLGVIGAGFVIGIRMVAEWFPPKDVGEAEGIYGGFGNFGSAASAMLLPVIALNVFGGDDGWRYSIMLTGAMCFIYGFIYYANVTDTPEGVSYAKPKRGGAMEVTSFSSLYGLIFMQLPMIFALGLLNWKLHNGGFVLTQMAHVIYGVLIAIFLFQAYKAWTVNAPHIRAGIPEKDKYSFRQVAILDVAYFVTFGSELAVVSMLPKFFQETFTMTPQAAGLVAASFAFMNLFARPMGGFLSDRLGSRRRTLSFLLAGLAVGYWLMSQLNGTWPIPLAILVTMTCSFFVQAGEGAVFSIVPLVKKRVTGQVAGMVGAYGNVGAVCFLTVFSLEGVDGSTFFSVIGGCAIFCLIVSLFLKEPEGSFADAHGDDEPAPAVDAA
ncbi:MAG: NarK family nitrate/nitrite MFS transporter [Planctomycetes bacterium]|jgi:NNP family nitrate/nitrite transporter-like MFS transporter|nr:NarK family nitrate/nitrite MFS transporter [Planctomycetota bacterium]MBT4028071.1 NarK family nitrate/nitrite MFS transporter [Planctomycetota bacterium]MBT4560144.1 NarK family nitrate/nitrite MFS transporter [Planctomycetota bacterium]MBT5101180.1 NarK family nitrate/nitrite MFS transporter [Planctomycetota bacterium]MBT7012084.1 NarK family nitrate/nitrite MFS transporter [Planctomycetota bacterium]